MFSNLTLCFLLIFAYLISSALSDNHCQSKFPKSSFKYRICIGVPSGVILSEIKNGNNELKLLCQRKPCLPKLESFTMQRSHLDQLPDGLFFLTGLKTLDLSYNIFENLNTIGCSAAKDLKNLILSHNNISTVNTNSFMNLTLLELLDLSYNELKSLEVRTFVQLLELRSLTLANNKLSKMDFGLFSSLKNLRILDISGNQLDIFYVGTMKSMNLLQLNMNSSQILRIVGDNRNRFVNSTFLQRTTLDLRYNFFVCSNLQEVLVIFIQNSVTFEPGSLKLLEYDEYLKGIECLLSELNDVFVPYKEDIELLMIVVFFIACTSSYIFIILLWILMKKFTKNSIEFCEKQQNPMKDLKDYELPTDWVFQEINNKNVNIFE